MIVANVSCVAIAGRALAIEGPSGSGKSSLALALIDRGARLVGDDGVRIEVEDGRLVAHPPPNIAGKIEIHGVGLFDLEPVSAPLALVLALDPDAPRSPVATSRELCGLAVPGLPFHPGTIAPARRAEAALERFGLG